MPILAQGEIVPIQASARSELTFEPGGGMPPKWMKAMKR
ncbi:hypothetical protein NSU_3037 [Novosphingobium pentaromativorans US6-1]|uniref:Uncharacterized protein n=1 Tax=Novosphingobium pentaromativorans US6-1 TaxID=1088721 RepID=G6EFB6_9SPHN|nr:hypothetical protein NSU_3037 [Novosphingobium pentaromativorans US6-1]